MEKHEEKPEMIYRFFGPSGLKVSALGFGTWMNYHDSKNPDSQKNLEKCVETAFSCGINFFDTAEMYGEGAADEMLGKCLSELKIPRKDLVIQTKLFKYKPGVNSNYLSRKHILEGMQSSLDRLKIDYVDIVLCHRYDDYTPIEEVCKGMNHLIQEGKAFYWGTSQWQAEEIMEAFDCCNQYGLIKPIVDQPQYSMLMRKDVEYDLCKLLRKKRYGVNVFAPLAGGLLTGKYNSGVPPENSRFEKKVRPSDAWTKFIKSDKKEMTLKKLNQLSELAKNIGCTQTELALAWVIRNTDVSSAVFGATKPEQIIENIKSLNVLKKWTPELENEIEKILDNQPRPRNDWRKWGAGKPRREEVMDLK